VYFNHLDSDDSAPRVDVACGQNFAQLSAIKRVYDPNSFFPVNNNIPPAAGVS